MVITMVAVHVVQVAVHQVVVMISVGDELMTAIRPMDVIRVVTSATMRRCTGVRVLARDRDRVLIDVTVVGVVQMPIVEIVHVPIMLDGAVATAGPMNMVMWSVNLAIRHCCYSFHASSEAFLFHVIERAGQQVTHVVIRDRVIDMFATSLLGEQPCAVQLLQSLRDRRHLLFELLRELGDAVLLIEQPFHQLESLRRTQRSKQARSVHNGALRSQCMDVRIV